MSGELSANADPVEARLEQWRAMSGRNPERRLKNLDDFKARRFDFLSPPPEAKPRFLINGKAVCTPGNLTAIIAQAKAGKSAFIGAMAAARFAAEAGTTGCDLLGVTVPPGCTGKVLWIDTEQSAQDFDAIVRRAIRRAGLESDPPCLVGYGLAGTPAPVLRALLADIMWHAYLDGIFAVIIDGVADLCADVNNAEECNALVAELHNAAIKYDCPIITVLHENPTQDSGKARGHLGSQLERKAESNLRLKKSEGITVVYSERMRRAPILEKDGPRFCWSEEDKMHVSCATAALTREDAKRERLRDLAEAVFSHAGSSALRYAEFLKAISAVRDVGPSAAEDRHGDMKKLGVICKDTFGFWRLNPVTP